LAARSGELHRKPHSGYNRDYLSTVAYKMGQMPENEREIRTKRRANGYEMWLPGLIAYTYKIKHGPQRKRKSVT